MAKSPRRQSALSSKPKKSLTDFMREKAKRDCLICKLPIEVRAQLGPEATKKGFTRPNQLEWLRQACGANSVTMEVLNQHLNRQHDREGDFNGT